MLSNHPVPSGYASTPTQNDGERTPVREEPQTSRTPDMANSSLPRAGVADARTLSADTSLTSKEEDSKMVVAGPPPLDFNIFDKTKSIVFCICAILFFDLVMPCILYYSLRNLTDINIETVLGISCACLGLGELLELPLRGWRLYRHSEEYAPLGQDAKWGFDFLFWWYLVATVIGIVPYAISTSLDTPLLWLFLFTPGLLIGFAIATTGISMIPFPLPFRVSSDAKGERCKPFVYYVIEDFMAVDTGMKRKYREELRARWNASQIFRTMIWQINLWWTVGGAIFMGALAAMTWKLDFEIAYGLSFGLIFLWMGLWALGTLFWMLRGLEKEQQWFSRNPV